MIDKKEKLKRHAVYKRKKTAKFAEYLIEIKNKPCKDCGKIFPHPAMEFDHLPGVDKKFKIGQAGTRSKDAIKKELEKCELVCSNCHRIRTKARKQSSRRATKLVDYIVSLKENKKCVDCNKVYPYECLQFDHLKPKEKLFNVAMPPASATKEDIDKEIAKCEIVCNCCHNIRTFNYEDNFISKRP
jgi:5-methylcytosine-specific restriction endonuclease McrA